MCHFQQEKLIIIIILIICYNKSNKKIHQTLQIKSRPKISIFLPTYNKEKYIRNAISSIQNQTLQDIEIIAVNDCSNDETLEILKNLSLTDKRIKIVNNKNNSGLLYSRAMGIIHSSGEYLMNLDPDDELYNSDNLEYLYNISNTWNVDIIEFNYYINKETEFI